MSAYGALADAGSALVFSNLGDPRDWPAANVVQFDPNDGESITGIGECGAGLLVFKPSKAWLVYDLDTGANRPLGAGVGCISHRSIAVTPYGTVWAGVKQVWVSDGSSVRPLADKLVSATPSTAPGIETYLLPGAAITGAYFDDRYQMSGQSADALTTFPLYEYDFVAKSWWQHTNYGGLLAIAQTASTAPQFYAAGTGRLDRMFDTPAAWLDSGGAALGRGWSGPYHTLGAGRDRLRGIEVEGSGMFGVAALPDFRDPLTGLGPREIRAEAAWPRAAHAGTSTSRSSTASRCSSSPRASPTRGRRSLSRRSPATSRPTSRSTPTRSTSPAGRAEMARRRRRRAANPWAGYKLPAPKKMNVTYGDFTYPGPEAAIVGGYADPATGDVHSISPDDFSTGHEAFHLLDLQTATDADRARWESILGLSGPWNQGTGLTGGGLSLTERDHRRQLRDARLGHRPAPRDAVLLRRPLRLQADAPLRPVARAVPPPQRAGRL
jgi:hypothetical protein